MIPLNKMTLILEAMLKQKNKNPASQCLSNDFKKAIKDKQHPLRKVITAFQHNDIKEANRLLGIELVNSLDDPNSPLQLGKLLRDELPRIKESLKQAEKHIKDFELESLDKYPKEINLWAAMNIQEEKDEYKRTEASRRNLKRATEAATKWREKDHLTWQKIKKDFNEKGINSTRKIAKHITKNYPQYKNAYEAIRKNLK